MNFDKTNLMENTLIITNDDGSITFISEEGATIEEQALFAEFRAEYPNGKPVPVLEPTTPVPTETELLQQQLKDSQERTTLLNNNLADFMEYIFTNIPTLP